MLSRVGREVLIKSVVQVIPTFAMSCCLRKDFVALLRRFWWGIPKGRTGIFWKAWDQLCRAKKNKGSEFSDFEVFNQAMLAKKLWRLHSRKDSLVAKTFKA